MQMHRYCLTVAVMCLAAAPHLVSAPHAACFGEAAVPVLTVTVSLKALQGCCDGIGRDLQARQHSTAWQVSTGDKFMLC